MDREALLKFMRAQPWAVLASTSDSGAPQAAVIGVVATDHLELFFDTLSDSRKAKNLRQNANVACVLGWDEGQTVQYEGVADEPSGNVLSRLKHAYFGRYPDGREREHSGNITYFRVRPRWIRYSDFREEPPRLATFWCEDGENPAPFLTALEGCVLEPARFNHRGHIFAAWAYLRTYGAIAGSERFETALRRYANHLGATQKYHATITFALLRMMAVRIATDPSCAWEDFANRNDDLFCSATKLLENHYSLERLESPEAKARVLSPDRAPLPELV